MLNFLKKIIPANFKTYSLYWVEYSKKMEKDLEEIFNCIDLDNYKEAKILIDKFNNTYNQSTVPLWVAEKMAQIHKAKSMLIFFTTPLEKEPLEILYQELLEREKWLGKEPASDVINGRIAELGLVIIRVQQLLLKEQTDEMESRKTTER